MYLQRNTCASNTTFYIPIFLVLLTVIIKQFAAQYHSNPWFTSGANNIQANPWSSSSASASAELKKLLNELANSSTNETRKDELKLKIACLAYGYCSPFSTDYTSNFFNNYPFGGNAGYLSYYGGGSAYYSPYTNYYYYHPYGSNIAGQNGYSGYNPFGSSIIGQGYGNYGGYGYGQGYGGYGYGYGKK